MKTVEKKRRPFYNARPRIFLQRQQASAAATDENAPFLSYPHNLQSKIDTSQSGTKGNKLQRAIADLIGNDSRFTKEGIRRIADEIIQRLQDDVPGGTDYNVNLLADFIRKQELNNLNRVFLAADALKMIMGRPDLVAALSIVAAIPTQTTESPAAGFSVRPVWLKLCLQNPAILQLPLHELISLSLASAGFRGSENIAMMYLNRLRFLERSYNRIPDDIMDRATQRSASTGKYQDVRCVPAALIASINAVYGITGLLNTMEMVFDKLVLRLEKPKTNKSDPLEMVFDSDAHLADQLASIYNRFIRHEFSPGDIQHLQEIFYLQMGILDPIGATKPQHLSSFHQDVTDRLANLGTPANRFLSSAIPEEARIVPVSYIKDKTSQGHAIMIYYSRFKGFMVYEPWGFAPDYRRTLRQFKNATSFEQVMALMRAYYLKNGWENAELSNGWTISGWQAPSDSNL